MGFWEAVTKILPESLIKVNTTIIDKRVIISDNKITIGDNEITDPNVMQKIFDEISKYTKEESLPFQVLHKDLEEDYTQTNDIFLKNKPQLKLLKQVLPPEDIECVLMSRRICLAFEKKERELIDNLFNQLDKKYPKRGRKINNLISAGYFDELIIPMIEVYKSQNIQDYKELFCKFFNEILRFFPTAIFVNSLTTEKKIEIEILKRLKLKRIPYIKIHSMGAENILKVENVLKIFESQNNLTINNNKFVHTSMGLNCQIVEIKIHSNFS